jgi:hypothetical protein
LINEAARGIPRRARHAHKVAASQPRVKKKESRPLFVFVPNLFRIEPFIGLAQPIPLKKPTVPAPKKYRCFRDFEKGLRGYQEAT